jgi:hypothetical protein
MSVECAGGDTNVAGVIASETRMAPAAYTTETAANTTHSANKTVKILNFICFTSFLLLFYEKDINETSQRYH